VHGRSLHIGHRRASDLVGLDRGAHILSLSAARVRVEVATRLRDYLTHLAKRNEHSRGSGIDVLASTEEPRDETKQVANQKAEPLCSTRLLKLYVANLAVDVDILLGFLDLFETLLHDSLISNHMRRLAASSADPFDRHHRSWSHLAFSVDLVGFGGDVGSLLHRAHKLTISFAHI